MSWMALLGMVLCAVGMATGVLLIGASVVGFGRCRPAAGSHNGLTQKD